MNIQLSNISEKLSKEYDIFVCSISFDERWDVIYKSTSDIKYHKYIIFGDTKKYKEEFDKLQKEVRNPTIIGIENKKKVELWYDVAKNITLKIKDNPELNILIDITTFESEILFFLIAQIKHLEYEHNFTFIYSGAKCYEEDLMHGVKEIRSILGYPGYFAPSKSRHHLIILLGFDLERAKELIKTFEPSSISIGIGAEPYSPDFKEVNKCSASKIEEFLDSLGNNYVYKETFEFSCSCPDSTKKAILEEAGKFTDSNITVSPMNTKVSSIGAALAAIEENELKLCYVEPLEFNIENYSQSGDMVSIFKI